MKAVLCKQYGGPETLVIEDVPSPVAKAGEVVITVHAAAVNFPDTLIIENKYQFKPPLPFSPGGEVSGVIKSVGHGVEGFAPGDRVQAGCGWGGFAEEVAVRAHKTTLLPSDVPLIEAAALISTYGTTYHALRDRAAMARGETLLVLGASGGTGIAAIEIGKLMGARVIAAASTAQKLALCKQYGADELIDYSKPDWREQLRTLTQGQGVDVVYDPVGGPYSEPALRSMAWGGRFLVIGFAAGEIPKPPLNLALLKGCSIVGVFFGAYAERQPQAYQALRAELMTWLASGRIRPAVTLTKPIEDAASVLVEVKARRAMGKIVLTTAAGRAAR